MSIEIQRIVCPIDFSDTSERAFDYALSLARVFDAQVHALHVIDDPILCAATTHQKFRDDFAVKANQRIDELASKHGVEGVTLTKAVKSGAAFYEIIQYAREVDADLIVIGSHGYGPIKHVLLGSQAEKVVRKAACPVLTVRPNQHQFVMP